MTDPKTTNIRALNPVDLPAVEGVIEAVGLFPADLLASMTAAYFAGEAGDAFWLTVDDGQPQAVAYIAPEQMTEGTWNLLLIAVHPAQQGQGVGAALVGHIEDALRQRGARLLLVETSGLPEFERTRAFYQKQGFGEEARIRDFYQAGEDKIVFRKALAGSRETPPGA